MSEELYKRLRPQRLKQIVGNDNTVAALRNMLYNKTLPHTLLFHGPSGCGKTTLARILARRLRCHEMDFKEVNSSNFRGIDTIRSIADAMHLSPVGKCRVWLIDECHKLTNDAQNAALKMLEDTPSHVYFLLCTTEPEKLIKPIRTRCCEMPVAGLSPADLEKLLARTVEEIGLDISRDLGGELVEACQGSPRTLLVMLDKVANLAPDEREQAVAEQLAIEHEGIDLCRALMKKASWSQVASILKNIKGDPEQIRWNVLGYARAVLLKKADAHAYSIILAFEQPFYNSKAAGLAAACYEALYGEDV